MKAQHEAWVEFGRRRCRETLWSFDLGYVRKVGILGSVVLCLRRVHFAIMGFFTGNRSMRLFYLLQPRSLPQLYSLPQVRDETKLPASSHDTLRIAY